MAPQLTIIIPVYNAEKTIQRTLNSLKRFDINHGVEVIFVNDGSMDASKQIIARFMGESRNKNHISIDKTNGGAASARNTALKIAKGEWLFFIDADDELLFNPLSWINRYPQKTAIGFSVVYCKNNKRYYKLKPSQIAEETLLDTFTSKNPFSPSSLLFKKAGVTQLFDPDFKYLEDWLFWIMNPKIYRDMLIIKSITSARMYMHANNKTSDQASHGIYRIKVANYLLKEYGKRLSQKQINNLSIQKRIGLIQQGIRLSNSFGTAIPCDPTLFVKLIIYVLLQRIKNRPGPYVV